MAIGPGFTRGDGTPSLRVLLSLELTPDVCIDKDGDGICADEDVCPNVDGVPQNHGCPADADYDGFTDAEDACPYDPGTRTADPKTTGCPDRDSDGVADRNDACVDVAGTPTSDPATNGCPKDAVPVEKLVIAEHAGFPEGGSAIDASAARVLEGVAKTMREHPQIRLRIEGHTDDREGTVGEMKALATARADAARKWLEEHGIDGGRLRSEGYGGDRLLDTTGTEAGRSKNRRVEFHAIED
jgi:outer membrane protein OmpA-like peptidoglycan-associated protein